METRVGSFFRMKALLCSSAGVNEFEAFDEDFVSSWTGAISSTIWLGFALSLTR